MNNPIDKENMIDLIRNSPDQLLAGPELAKDVKLSKFNSIVLSGMGGSALVGDLLQIYLNDMCLVNSNRCPVKIYTNRSYSLPPESFEPGCLNIISSYSGNTEETLSCYYEALKNKLDCLGITNGGKLAELCRESNVPLISLPKPAPDFQPRIATGYSFTALLCMMANAGVVSLDTRIFNEAAKKIKSEMQVMENFGQEIAKKVQGKTPIVYAPVKYGPLAMIWKIMFNENAKTPAFWNFFPELSHNEMVGFTKPQGNFIFIFLRDRNNHPQNIKRMGLTVGLFKEYGFDSVVADIPDGESVYRIFSCLQIGSFASYHLALSYNIDPTPVEMVEKLKKLLAS